MTAKRIRVSGKPKRNIDVDALLQAVLLIAEQRLHDQQQLDDRDGDADAGDDRQASA
jgi:hypothetical protein